MDTSTAMHYSTLHDDHSQHASQSTSLVAGVYRCSLQCLSRLLTLGKITALHFTTSKLICNNSIWQYLGIGQIPALSGPADIIRELPTNESDTTHPVLSTMYSKHDWQLPCTASAHGLTHSSQQPSPSRSASIQPFPTATVRTTTAIPTPSSTQSSPKPSQTKPVSATSLLPERFSRLLAWATPSEPPTAAQPQHHAAVPSGCEAARGEPWALPPMQPAASGWIQR